MSLASALLPCLAKACAKHLVNLVTFGVGGDLLIDAWEMWERRSRELKADAAKELQQLANASPAEMASAARAAVSAAAADLPPEQQAQLVSYLTQVPAALRRSLRR